MGLPAKQRTSRSKKERNSHAALKKQNIRFDKDGNPVLPHRVNPATGMYKGRQVVDTQKRAARTLRNKRNVA